MRIICVALALLATSAAAQAHAQDAPDQSSSLSDVQLNVGSGLLFSNRDDTAIQRYNVYFMPRLSFHDRVYIAPLINLSTIDLALRQPRDLPLDVDMTLPWQMSLGFDLRYRHPLLRWLDLTVFYRFEFPTSNNEAKIDGFKIHPQEGAPDVNVTLDQVRKHISVVHTWRHFDLGATLTAHVGWWHPFIDIGYTSTVGRLAVDFEQEATDLLGSAGINPDRFYDTSLQSMYYAAGSEFDIGGDFRLRFQGTVVFLSDSWVVNTDTALVIPLDTK
jgi:hypothetical protein